MTIRSIPVIAIVGRSKTGKTTLVERLIPFLRDKGLRIATVKHHHKDFEIDIPGKDTYRHRKAGARLSVISSPGKVALIEETEEEMTIETILSRFISAGTADLVIVEGYKRSDLPKVEVYTKKEGVEPVCVLDKNLLAIVSDRPIPSPVPVFLRDDIGGILNFIVSRLNVPNSEA